MSPPRLRLVGLEEAEPPEQVRPAPRLACLTCGARVMAARCGEFVVILSDHRCEPLPPFTAGSRLERLGHWLDDRPWALTLGAVVLTLVVYAAGRAFGW